MIAILLMVACRPAVLPAVIDVPAGFGVCPQTGGVTHFVEGLEAGGSDLAAPTRSMWAESTEAGAVEGVAGVFFPPGGSCAASIAGREGIRFGVAAFRDESSSRRGWSHNVFGPVNRGAFRALGAGPAPGLGQDSMEVGDGIGHDISWRRGALQAFISTRGLPSTVAHRMAAAMDARMPDR